MGCWTVKKASWAPEDFGGWLEGASQAQVNAGSLTRNLGRSDRLSLGEVGFERDLAVDFFRGPGSGLYEFRAFYVGLAERGLPIIQRCWRGYFEGIGGRGGGRSNGEADYGGTHSERKMAGRARDCWCAGASRRWWRAIGHHGVVDGGWMTDDGGAWEEATVKKDGRGEVDVWCSGWCRDPPWIKVDRTEFFQGGLCRTWISDTGHGRAADCARQG